MSTISEALKLLREEKEVQLKIKCYGLDPSYTPIKGLDDYLSSMGGKFKKEHTLKDALMTDIVSGKDYYSMIDGSEPKWKSPVVAWIGYDDSTNFLLYEDGHLEEIAVGRGSYSVGSRMLPKEVVEKILDGSITLKELEDLINGRNEIKEDLNANIQFLNAWEDVIEVKQEVWSSEEYEEWVKSIKEDDEEWDCPPFEDIVKIVYLDDPTTGYSAYNIIYKDGSIMRFGDLSWDGPNEVDDNITPEDIKQDYKEVILGLEEDEEPEEEQLELFNKFCKTLDQFLGKDTNEALESEKKQIKRLDEVNTGDSIYFEILDDTFDKEEYDENYNDENTYPPFEDVVKMITYGEPGDSAYRVILIYKDGTIVKFSEWDWEGSDDRERMNSIEDIINDYSSLYKGDWEDEMDEKELADINAQIQDFTSALTEFLK